jgi:hypothetical protein
VEQRHLLGSRVLLVPKEEYSPCNSFFLYEKNRI